MKWLFPTVLLTALAASAAVSPRQEKFVGPLRMDPPHISSDKSVRYDYDIVYVRAPRREANGRSRWAEVGDPRSMEPGADLMLLHPDGKEEVLVAVKDNESIADPSVSFDGQSVYFARFHDVKNHKGSDIYKIHVPTRKIVRLTEQVFTPNTGAADWSKTLLPAWGVHNLGPCPLPGGKMAFVSDRNAFKAVNPGYAPNALALQLFVMDEDGSNLECIGHLNLGMALHPVILKDGRLMFSSLESQGLRSHHLWGVWSIHPDGTRWGPLFSAFEIGNGTADSTHFQTQLSDGSVVVESYYNLNNFGFGTYYKFPPQAPEGYPAFGPAYKSDPRNGRLRHGRHADGRGIYIQFPFSPHGIEALTPFVLKGDWPSLPADPNQKDSPRVGKFTHPSGAPDNHLLTVWSPGSLNSYTRFKPAFDSGIYLIKSGKPIDEPGQMLLIKNDPKYHEQWPRALVPYKRTYGIEEPRRLAPLANDGKQSWHLPEGTPFGLVGSSSLYKRESYPYGVVRPGSVTASFAGEKDPTGHRGHDTSFNWTVQGADAGLYENEDIHAIRILALEPTSDTRPKGGRNYYNHAKERLRILGEIPVRKFASGKEPLDPDGNPDTSFLAKLPADTAWTFQTLDRNGMVLNMAQTWHQLRPGEIRHDCGGCHAHSQKPTLFQDTAAAKADYPVFDLTKQTPLLTSKAKDESGKKWDAKDTTGLRFARGVKNVEYFRDVKPIFERSCIACHTHKGDKPAGKLVLDDDTIVTAQNPAGLGFTFQAPGTYVRLAADAAGKYGHNPLHRHGWTNLSASRYVRLMQSRRSLLIWKVFGRRLDGWDNEDFPHETIPGNPQSLRHKGKPVPDTPHNREIADIAYTGSSMPPPAALAGTYKGPDGKTIKVAPLTDEDRLTLVRWIDLGCPIDFDYDVTHPERRGHGWMCDDKRPTLTLTYPRAGKNEALTRIVIGMHDYYTGLDRDSFQVTADFPIDGIAAGENLAKKFRSVAEGVWEWKPNRPITDLPRGQLTIAVKDRQGNLTRIERTFAVVNASSRVPRLIEQLGHADFNVREKATEELAKLGRPARRALKAAAADSKDAEVRRRAQAILKEMANRDRPRYALLEHLSAVQGHKPPLSERQLATAIYLLSRSTPATEEELRAAEKRLHDAKDRTAEAEELMWSLLTGPGFNANLADLNLRLREVQQSVQGKATAALLSEEFQQAPRDLSRRLIAATAGWSDEQRIEVTFMLTIARFPAADQVKTPIEYLKKADNRTQAREDILWALMNTKEFIFGEQAKR